MKTYDPSGSGRGSRSGTKTGTGASTTPRKVSPQEDAAAAEGFMMLAGAAGLLFVAAFVGLAVLMVAAFALPIYAVYLLHSRKTAGDIGADTIVAAICAVVVFMVLHATQGEHPWAILAYFAFIGGCVFFLWSNVSLRVLKAESGFKKGLFGVIKFGVGLVLLFDSLMLVGVELSASGTA